MGRRGPIPKPWFRKATGTWYVTLDGEQSPLGKTEREANVAFHRLMVSRGELAPVDSNVTVRELFESWLADCKCRLAASTVQGYEITARSFLAACGGLRASMLRPIHVTNWINKKKLSQSTRHLWMTHVKLAMQWGEDQGQIEKNGIRRIKPPAILRRAPITLEQANAIIDCVIPSIANALRVILVTGARPGELCSMTAENTNIGARRAIVRGKRTKNCPDGIRTLFLSSEAIEILRPIVESHPVGHLFFGHKSRLTVDSLEYAVESARDPAAALLGRKEGSLDHVTPHCFRGLYSTEALRRRVDSALVSKLLGHSDPSILIKHYANLDDDLMQDAANRATRTLQSKPDNPLEPAP